LRCTTNKLIRPVRWAGRAAEDALLAGAFRITQRESEFGVIASLMTNPAGSAVANDAGPIRQIVQGEAARKDDVLVLRRAIKMVALQGGSD